MSEYTPEHPLRVFTAFSGYDSQCMALERIGMPYELVGWSEFDPESKLPIDRQAAVIAHNAVFPQWRGRNYGDICKIDWESVPDFDLFTYSFPCQDISLAGKRKGFAEDSGTRSALLWKCKEAIQTKMPEVAVMENVKALLNYDNRPLFRDWEQYLASLGYDNYVKVLNSADYGVPQSRERCFMVSLLHSRPFHFPEPRKLEKHIIDIVEEKVDEKYYLKEKQVKSIIDHCERKQAEGCGFHPNFRGGQEIATCLTTRYGCYQTDTYYDESKRTDGAE